MPRRLHLKRYRQIIRILIRNGFGVLLDQLGILKYLRIRHRRDAADLEQESRYSIGERLRRSCEDLGPTFIKIGQILSTRPDVLSPEIASELQKLQDAVNPFPFAQVKQMIETSFGEKLEDVFPQFDEKPLAAASLSQVHSARLPTNQLVVVKVQRPGIDESIKVDLEILQDLVDFVDNHTRYGELYDLKGMVEELERTLTGELDFRKEGENADRFREIFTDHPGIKVPQIRWIYTTDRVLTMSRAHGMRIDQIEQLKKSGIDCSELGVRLARSVMRQIMEDGFFHADPHPGNMLVHDDGTITLLDLGMVGRLSQSRKKILSSVFIGIAAQDAHQVVRAFVDLNTMKQRVNLHRFESDVDKLLDQYLSLPLNEIQVGELLAKMFQLAYAYHIRIPSEFTLIAKVLITLQSILEQLDPDLNILVIMKPLASKLMHETFSLEDMAREGKRAVSDYGRLLKIMPSFLVNLFHKLEDDAYNMQIDIKDINKVQKHLDEISNRISFSIILLSLSIIIAGIIVGSSLNVSVAPALYTINIIILRVGLIIAGLILIGLLVSMIRSRRF